MLIVGPKCIADTGAYGGGMGGYTRNMSVYLSTLGGKDLELSPFYHSVRNRHRSLFNSRPIRMMSDTLRFFAICVSHRPDAVHILAQYRSAIAREFVQVLICQMLRIPIGYDVKAGAFELSIDLNP